MGWREGWRAQVPSSGLVRSTIFLVILAGTVWAAVFARFALAPFQTAMTPELGLSDNQIALVQGTAFALPMIFASIPLGLAVDRFSRSRLMILFSTLLLVGTVAAALAREFELLLAARCIVGLSVAAILITVPSLVADYFAPSQYGRAGIVVGVGEIGGSPAAFGLGGLLLGFVGQSGWRTGALCMSLALVPVVAAAYFLREPSRAQTSKTGQTVAEAWAVLWRFRAMLVPLLVARTMVWIADGAALIWAAPAFERTFGLSSSQVGGMMAVILLVSGVCAPIFGGLIADTCQRHGGPHRTVGVLVLLAIMCAPAGLFAIAATSGIAAVGLALFLVLSFMTGGIAGILSIIVIPAEIRGLFVSVTMLISALLGIALAPVLVSHLAGVLGGGTAIASALAIICTGSSILGAVVFGLGRRAFKVAEQI